MDADPHRTSQAFQSLLDQLPGNRRTVVSVRERPAGPQGASGALIRYYDITTVDAGGTRCNDVLVTKAAGLFERRVLQLLAGQGCAVPPVYLPDVTTEGRQPIYMPYLETRPPRDLGHPQSPLTGAIAAGLAHIHAANRLAPPSWLPHVSDDYRGRLWLHAWRAQWEENLSDPEFAAEFGPYTTRLDAAMDRLLRILDVLTGEGTSLTIINTDLIPEDIRLWRGQPCFIDWEQAAYGSLYLDLPNYFLVETALAYRDALDAHGFAIPVPEFLERYHEVGRYMGLRYLGYSLWGWAQGGAQRGEGRWFLYYTFKLALHGR